MTSNRFLVKPNNLHLPLARLDGEEHHHLSRVLRVQPGEKVWLMDERGNAFQAEVIEVGRKQTRLRVLEKEAPASPKVRLVLGQALIKTKNMEWVIQKASELGVQAIVPVEAARSVLKLKGREGPKLARWRRIAREAVKQSRRTDIPSILPSQPISLFLESRDESIKFILCEHGGVLLRSSLADPPVDSDPSGIPGIVILVGPEGGWSREEEEQALGSGFRAVSLGTRILRSETAALAALAAIQIFWGE